ncbi:MAG: amidohydrolase family protein [Pirellulales bacterium]|nr:amidohydrolase family protein [Pirellulales bacterium]
MDSGIVTIQGGWIIDVGNHPPPGIPVRDVGDAILLPGFINAHTHLEFSDLDCPLGHQGMELAAWIRLVLDKRTCASRRLSTAISSGLDESIRSGVTTLAEIATRECMDPCHSGMANGPHGTSTPVALSGESWNFGCDQAPEIASEAPMRSHPYPDRPEHHPAIHRFLEIIGFSRARAESAYGALRSRIARWEKSGSERSGPGISDSEGSSSFHAPRNRIGISPHAPYTVSVHLLEQIVDLARRENLPIAMHLAESFEELQFLDSVDGPFRDLLLERSMWDPGSVLPRSRPLDYLIRLAKAPRAIIIHGNYLSDDELEFLAARRDHMAIIYCPRTHAYFAHPPYPLARSLERGVRVALGTDSRASNPDLSLLSEMRAAYQNHPKIAPESILRMGTLSGAEALGIGNLSGSIAPGKLANIVAVPFTDATPGDPFLFLIGSDATVSHLWLEGKEVF